jgi:inhibitor of KinA
VGEEFPRVVPVGESALLVEMGDSISNDINQRILTIDQQLQQRRISGVVEWIPAYSSILVIFDPAQTTEPAVCRWLDDCLTHQEEQILVDTRKIEISVRYGGQDGPDLNFVADYHGLTPAQVVESTQLRFTGWQ